jgi:hypothetical protein
MRRFGIGLLGLILIACAPAASPERDSRFAGFFPYDSTGRDLPIWATSVETALPMVLKVIKGFDVAYQGSYESELTDVQINRFRIFQIRGTSLERDRIEIYLGGEADRVALGVFEADSGGKLIPGSQADKLEDAVIVAMDGLYKRSPD